MSRASILIATYNFDALQGAMQLHELFTRIGTSREMFEFRTYTRLK